MTSSSKPTLIFVPGAWHSPACYSAVIERLQSGSDPYKCVTVELGSVGAEPGSPSLQSWQPDVDAVRGAVQKELEEGNDVLLVCHSYGTLPTQEAPKGVDLGGRVKQLIIAGFILDVGESLVSISQGNFPPLWDIRGDVIYPNDPENAFYHDLPIAEQKHWSSLLKSQTYASKKSPLTYTAWRYIPTTFVIAEEDRAIPAFLQEGFCKAAIEKGASLKVQRLPSSHSPFLSMPDKVVECIKAAAGDSR